MSRFKSKPVVVRYDASPTGKAFHRSNADTRMVMGPVGSGKSTMAINELIMLAVQQVPDKWGDRTSKWLIVRETYPQLRNTVFESFKMWLRPNGTTVRYTESAPMRIRWTDRLADGSRMNAEFIFLAVKDPSDYENVKSFEITGAFINEAGAMDHDIVAVVNSRIGRFPPPVDAVDEDNPITQTALLIDSNPPDEDSWMSKAFANLPQHWEAWQQPGAILPDSTSDTGWKLNPDGENFKYLGVGPEKYYLDKVGGMTREQIRVLFEGKFGVTSHGKAVYRRQFSDDMHVSNSNLVAVKGHKLYLGWDFGKGGEALTIAQKTPTGCMRVLASLVAENIGLHDFAKNIVKPHMDKYYPQEEWPMTSIISVGDPSGVSSHGLSKDTLNYFDVLNNSKDGVFGDWFTTRPAKSNHIELRLNAVRYYLTGTTTSGAPAFQLNKSCGKLRRGFNAGYAYKRMQVSGDARYKDKPDKNDFSHPHDSLQYICLEAHPKYNELVKHTSFVTREVVDKVVNY